MSCKMFVYAAILLCVFSLSCSSSALEFSSENPSGDEKAKDFTLTDLAGADVSLKDFQEKKTVLLDFTTTWCPHCITIIPAMKQIYSKYSESLEVIAVYLGERKADVSDFVKTHSLPYRVLVDETGDSGSLYKIRGVPTLIIVDKKGFIRYIGHEIKEDVIEKVIEQDKK